MTTNLILHITDKYGVSQGYEPAFGRLLNKAGLRRNQVTNASIYRLVPNPLRRYGNEKAWKFDEDQKAKILEAFDARVKVIKPKVIAVSDPACLGILANWDRRIATIDKMRGGVYEYQGIPVVVVQPITAIHRNVDERIVRSDDGEETDTQEPYRVPHGSWTLAQDWGKVSRVYHGKRRVFPPFRYSVVRTIDDAIAAKKFLLESMLISTDIETGCAPPQITCIGYAGIRRDGAIKAFVFPFADESSPDGCFTDEDTHEFFWETCCEINNSPIPKTMQNGLYDCSYFLRDRLGVINYMLDSMYMWWSVYPELPKTLDFISSVLLDDYQYWKDDIKGQENESARGNMEAYWRYNALDCRNTLLNTVVLLMILNSDKRWLENYRDVMLRFFSGLQMSMRGVKADFARREEHRKTLQLEADRALAKLRFMIADRDFNVNSPAQKHDLLYNILGATPRTARGRKTKLDAKGDANKPSSGAIAMRMIKTDHPFFRIVCEQIESAMTPLKQISNVCNIKLYTDRFRCSFNPVGTETGRYSSKSSNFWDGSNVQNIRKDYRDWLVADDGCVFLDVDYSQSDDVFMGYESQDPEKIAVVESGVDAHAVNGELFFGVPYEQIVAGKKAGDPMIVHPTRGIRQLAKRIVHGTNFQMAAVTLYVTMGRDAVVAAAKLLGFRDAESWDQDRLVNVCQMLMSKYRKKYRRLTKDEYYKEIYLMLKNDGVVTTAFNHTRKIMGDPDENGTQREATAFIGQGDTAGNMNRVMAEVDWGFIPERFRDGLNPDRHERPRRMSWDSHGFRFHIQVHDNFVAQLNPRNPNWKEAAHNLLHVMNRPVIIHGREVRVAAEAELSIRWANGTKGWDGKDPHDLDRIIVNLKR